MDFVARASSCYALKAFASSFRLFLISIQLPGLDFNPPAVYNGFSDSQFVRQKFTKKFWKLTSLLVRQKKSSSDDGSRCRLETHPGLASPQIAALRNLSADLIDISL